MLSWRQSNPLRSGANQGDYQEKAGKPNPLGRVRGGGTAPRSSRHGQEKETNKLDGDALELRKEKVKVP